jgi:hypothetical protein
VAVRIGTVAIHFVLNFLLYASNKYESLGILQYPAKKERGLEKDLECWQKKLFSLGNEIEVNLI